MFLGLLGMFLHVLDMLCSCRPHVDSVVNSYKCSLHSVCLDSMLAAFVGNQY